MKHTTDKSDKSSKQTGINSTLSSDTESMKSSKWCTMGWDILKFGEINKPLVILIVIVRE